MKKRERSAAAAQHISDNLRCPLCNAKIGVEEFKSLVCSNHHTFDFAKQGYVNLLQKPVNTQYDDALFEARRKIICDAKMYEPIHKEIAAIIERDFNEEALMFDAGSGEGSHLQKILDEVGNQKLTGIGLDISKEGVVMAAKHYEAPLWIVGDLANPPLADESCKYILNILSPANYKEFKRILTPDGLIIKVIPGSDYLKELRQELFNNTDESEYENNDTIKLLEKNVKLTEQKKVTYKKTLNEEALSNLISMTPLGWHAEKEEIEKFVNSGEKEITIDLDILIASAE